MNNIVKGILLSAALIGVGTGGYFAYKKISDQNTQIATLQKENTQKDNEIIALNIELDKKQGEINSLSEKLQTANKNLETLQAKVNTLEQDILSRDENISTLSKQKKTLLTAVTEIDTKVTQSTNSVEIETLQERKIAILTQIDELNTQISQLNTEKQTLQAEMTELKTEKANLEKEIEQLKAEKQQLENEIASLNVQIETFSSISKTVNESTFEYICESPSFVGLIFNRSNVPTSYKKFYVFSGVEKNMMDSTSPIRVYYSTDVLVYSLASSFERIWEFNAVNYYSGEYDFSFQNDSYYQQGIRSKGITIGSLYRLSYSFVDFSMSSHTECEYYESYNERCYNFKTGTNVEIVFTLDGVEIDVSDIVECTDSIETKEKLLTNILGSDSCFSIYISSSYELNDSNEVVKFVVNYELTTI